MYPTASVPVLNTNSAAYLLLKHNFPPTKWRDLAVGLKQVQAISSIEADKLNSISCLVVLITHWVAVDKDKSWEMLVDAIDMSEETVLADKLAHDVGVSHEGELSYTSNDHSHDCAHFVMP